MSTRRTFLQSALFLPSLLSASAFAQDNPDAAPFADFEGGGWGDWTTEGDAFAGPPATDALFPGRVQGFGGRAYASTFHARRGVKATGRAISREFVIEKPVITFKIGGGDFPGDACLNLLVDGKVERTATGDGTAKLSVRSWDVAEFAGKKARLEIVDSTTSANRGYVMADDIRFTGGQVGPAPETGREVTPPDVKSLPYQQQVTDMAEGWRAKYGLPGVWCAFIKDGRVQACVASGTRKVGEHQPVSVNDHLNVGSVSKVITGSLIAFFVADGTVKYETTAGEVFPELARQYPQSLLLKATLRQLITHTAGLTGGPAYGTDRTGGVAWRYDQLRLSLNLPGLREPGKNYQYSNVGPVIAVAMVEKLSGSSYESWLYGDLGKRLGLSDPKMLDYSAAPLPGQLTPHYLENGIATVSTGKRGLGYKYAPQGSCSVTLTDLCLFARTTMTNSARYPERIYEGMIHFPAEAPLQVLGRTGEPVTRVLQNTSAGWAGNDQKYLVHSGSTGRGEYCEIWINCRKRQSVIFYTNCNNKNGKQEFMQGIVEDLNLLRSL